MIDKNQTEESIVLIEKGAYESINEKVTIETPITNRQATLNGGITNETITTNKLAYNISDKFDTKRKLFNDSSVKITFTKILLLFICTFIRESNFFFFNFHIEYSKYGQN